MSAAGRDKVLGIFREHTVAPSMEAKEMCDLLNKLEPGNWPEAYIKDILEALGGKDSCSYQELVDWAFAAEKDCKVFSWPPLESNPEVFTNYMHSIGLAKTVAIGEVFGFDEDLLSFLPQPIHATIVCYERLKRKEDVEIGSVENNALCDYYMKQSGTLDNACGIIACIHAALNTGVDIAEDSILGRFRAANKSASPEERCVSLEGNDEFKSIHSSFAMQGQSGAITSNSSSVKHHFVAFVVKGGKLLELDGTKKGAHMVGDSTDVLRGSIAEIQRRLAAGEISDSLSMMTLNAAE